MMEILSYAGADKAPPGSQITIRVEGGVEVSAEVVKLPFYDANNSRQEM